MANGIETLLGMGLGPEDDMRALARNLRREQAIGDYHSGSSSQRVSDYGRNLSERSRKSAQVGGGLRQAQAQEATRKLERDEDYQRDLAAGELRHKRAKDVLKFREDIKAPVSNKIKPTGKAVESYLKSRQLIEQITDVQGLRADLSPEKVEMLNKPLMDTITDFALPAGIERYVQGQFIYDDPDVKAYREKVADIESEFSKLMSGLAVTGYEMADRQKWSPYASGISQEDRERRLVNLSDKLKTQRSLQEETYTGLGDFKDVPYSIMRQPEVEPGTEIVTQGQAPGVQEFEEEKVIGGITYGRKSDGKWYTL